MKVPEGTGSLAWGSPGSVIVMIVVAAVFGGSLLWDFSWLLALLVLYFVVVALASGRAYLATRREDGSARRSPRS